MKRIALFTAALMILSFGLANAQDICDLAGAPAGSWDSGTKVNTGVPITFTIRLAVSAADPADIRGATNGWTVYMTGAASGAPLSLTYTVANLSALWDGGQPATEFFNGVSPENLGVAGFSFFKNGLPSGYVENAYVTITTSPMDVAYTETGAQLCIDTAFYPPGGYWLWSDATPKDRVPDWNGPYCYNIHKVPNLCPVIGNAPVVQLSGSHCTGISYDFNATDPEADAITFVKKSGIGAIDPVSGVWSYSPTLADVGTVFTVVVTAIDGFHTAADCPEVSFDVVFTNAAPTIACQGLKQVGKGNVINIQITGNDVDCDPGTFSLGTITPAPVGMISIDPNTGLLTFATDVADAAKLFAIEVIYSDGNLSATCTQQVEVLATEPFGIFIEKTEMSFQGQHEFVDVSIFKGSEQLWGFDLLIAYDASVLSFQAAIPGDIYTECGWEYFTYRYGASGNCNGGCPSGLLRVVGFAENNDGANHPDCYGLPTPPAYSLFTLDFLVSDNRTYECQYAPIRFFWLDCGDNALSYHEVAAPDLYSQLLGISRAVYDFAFDADGNFVPENGSLITLPTTFPSWGGAIDGCDDIYDPNKPAPIRWVDFYNGGIDIACADEIDARGDINLDGQVNTIADAVLLSNYFVYGMGVFTINVQGQIAASDVNADGIALSVADLVYLIRVVVGDALPYPKLSPVTAEISNVGGVLSVDQSMGAAYVVVEGQVTPTLLASGVDMKFAYDAAENVTRVLVVGMTQGAAFEGNFLQVNGAVRSIEMATYYGAPVKATMPTTFSLSQNYPNPFNPTTTISFTLPKTSDYTITVYNVTGQVVANHSGNGQGQIDWTFDASDLSSGIYFYNVTADNDSATKKMVLIK
jgi:hypothetical protein